MYIRTLINDDQRPLKLSHALRIDAEIRLQRLIQLHPFGNIDKASPTPNTAVQCCELIIRIGHQLTEIFLKQIRMLL